MSALIINGLIIILQVYQLDSTSQYERSWNTDVMEDVPCSENGMINNIFGISISDCADECLLRNRCDGILYHHGVKRCSLLDSSSNNASGMSSGTPTCSFVRVKGLSKDHLGKCSKITCDNSTKCMIKDEEAECYAAECGAPPEVQNATLLSNIRSVGSKNAYLCDAGYTPYRQHTITCLGNGTWSVTELRCIKGCPTPKPTNNSDIVFISSGDYSVGTLLRYECKEGFVMTRAENITAECMSNGRWSLYSVPCCRADFQLAPANYGNYCYKLFRNDVANSFEEMRDYCTGIDRRLSSYNTHLFKYVFEQNQSLQYIITSYRKGNWVYVHMEKCINALIDGDPELIPPEINSLTFDELASLVRTQGWESVRYCSWVSYWAEGQPDGGDEMRCSYVPRSTMSAPKLYDIPCTWNSTQFNGEEVGFICYEDRQLVS